MKTKAFDCVEMKHRGAQRVQDLLKQMSLDEQLAFWKKETDALRALQDKLNDHARNR